MVPDSETTFLLLLVKGAIPQKDAKRHVGRRFSVAFIGVTEIVLVVPVQELHRGVQSVCELFEILGTRGAVAVHPFPKLIRWHLIAQLVMLKRLRPQEPTESVWRKRHYPPLSRDLL